MIKVNNISYSIVDTPILQDVSFSVAPGEMLVILGGNGAGKSTLLKAMCGDILPQQGSIAMQGKNITEWKHNELASFRAVLQQQTMLSMPFTVSEVVMMGRYPHFNGKEQDIDHSIVKSALKKTGVDHLADRNYLYLSGGEQQRVHLARVFAQVWETNKYDNRYLFMDEPINSLDIRHQHTALELAREFTQDGNIVVAVLHDLNLAIQYADKILLLKKGKIIAHGTPEQVIQEETISEAYDYPLSIFTSKHYQHPVVVPFIQSVNN